MRIWLINQYAMPPELESRLRTIKFAHYLGKQGHDVTIFAASQMHNMDINLIKDSTPYIEKMYGDLHFVHIRTIRYKSNGFKRLFSLIEFPLRFLTHYKKFKKPDIIIQTATVPWGNMIYKAVKKIGAKYIVEVVDLWPESFVAFKVISKHNPFVKFAYWAERRLYTKADSVVFSMEGGSDYIKDKKWDIDGGGTVDLKKLHYINNGVDLADFQYYKDNFYIEDKDLADENTFKVIYLGSVRHANNVKSLIDASILLKDYPNIRFFIYGDGEQRLELEEFCTKNDYSNVVFKQNWIDPKYVPFVVSQASLNILNYLPNTVDRYGGSQSKFFQYLAAGKPICSNIDMGRHCLINRHHLGVAQSFKNEEEYAKAILSIYNMSKVDYDATCARVKSLASEFDYGKLTNDLVNIL